MFIVELKHPLHIYIRQVIRITYEKRGFSFYKIPILFHGPAASEQALFIRQLYIQTFRRVGYIFSNLLSQMRGVDKDIINTIEAEKIKPIFYQRFIGDRHQAFRRG